MKGFESISNMTQQKYIASPPSGMNLKTHTLAPTTVIDLPSPVNAINSPTNASHALSKFTTMFAEPTARTEAPAFPYLASMINKAHGIAPGKKVVFDRSDYDDLLGQIIDQREHKKQKEHDAIVQSKEEETELLAY